MPIPNIIGVILGMTKMASTMMKSKIEKFWPDVYEMIKMER